MRIIRICNSMPPFDAGASETASAAVRAAAWARLAETRQERERIIAGLAGMTA